MGEVTQNLIVSFIRDFIRFAHIMYLTGMTIKLVWIILIIVQIQHAWCSPNSTRPKRQPYIENFYLIGSDRSHVEGK